jgi:hypothetical protein
MGEWLSLPMFIAFILGVLASTMVKSAFSQVKGKVSGA